MATLTLMAYAEEISAETLIECVAENPSARVLVTIGDHEYAISAVYSRAEGEPAIILVPDTDFAVR